MSEIEEAVKESIEGKADWPLNSWIAGCVAIVATIMAIGNIKDGNIVQAMAQAQSRGVDSWSYYQAKSLKQLLAENAAEQLRTHVIVNPSISPALRDGLEKRIARYDAEARRYDKEKEEIRKQAEAYQKEYDQLNVFDDQFDMAEACLTISIALFGVTALTRKRWLFLFAAAIASTGAALSLAGFLHLRLHPEWLARLLS
ncbi:MAG: DUF4337 domain-containing protein [Bryobacterales bacterium]|nr:DUF4337 domain-containing protein [Bryobacterales bacterium]